MVYIEIRLRDKLISLAARQNNDNDRFLNLLYWIRLAILLNKFILKKTKFGLNFMPYYNLGHDNQYIMI